MRINIINAKRGSGKTKECVEKCRIGVFENKNVLLLVNNNREARRITTELSELEPDNFQKIDEISFDGDFMYKIKGKRYDLVVIDECFEMRLDAQAKFLEDMSAVNLNTEIIGYGTEVRRKTFRDYITKEEHEI